MPLDELEIRVLKFVQENQLIPHGSRVLVALSGGVDSVCLLHILLNIKSKLQIKLLAAHLNHMIRPSAIHDEKFVIQLCKNLGVELYIERADVPKFCRENKIGIEEGARTLRYNFLEKVRKESSSDLIALAHNLNDLGETILHRIVRGTGLTGLVCMKPKDGVKVRPLLYISRSEIEDYARRKKLNYVEDESNYDVRYTRNFIRHRVLPILKEINPDLESSLKQLHFAANLLEKHLLKLIEKSRLIQFQDRVIFSINDLDEFEIVELLKYCTEKFNEPLNYRQIESISRLLSKSSFSVCVADKLWIKKGFQFISIERERNKISFVKLDDFKEYNFNGWIFKLSDRIESENYIALDKNKNFIRSRRPGDKIGKIKIKDLMINSRIPEFLRDEYPIICDDDKIVWIPYVYKCQVREVSGIFLSLIFDPYGCILKMSGLERRKRFERQ